jgi:hypothetical protein
MTPFLNGFPHWLEPPIAASWFLSPSQNKSITCLDSQLKVLVFKFFWPLIAKLPGHVVSLNENGPPESGSIQGNSSLADFIVFPTFHPVAFRVATWIRPFPSRFKSGDIHGPNSNNFIEHFCWPHEFDSVFLTLSSFHGQTYLPSSSF